ncbi:MAG: 2-oxoacid:acceptor oxidoreductase subunit alpha [Candidatus Glassbacteria bacterium]
MARRKGRNGFDMTIRACGIAGDGVILAGNFLVEALNMAGLSILTFNDYGAEIKGSGKTVFQVRASESEIHSRGGDIDLLIALNNSFAAEQLGDLKEGAIVIYDNDVPTYMEEKDSLMSRLSPDIVAYGVPMGSISSKVFGITRSKNIAAVGAFGGIFGFPMEPFEDYLRKRFAKRGPEVTEKNLKCLRMSYEYGRDEVMKRDRFHAPARPKTGREKLILMGNESVAYGAMAAGLGLYAGYPITPATKIMEILAKELVKMDGTVVQTEDEISAIATVIGAFFAGKRAMTATSGPGLCLMTEMINLSVMAESPAVIINCQRGGPSTGLPTKSEQSDLLLAVHGASGDSPRVVLAPTNVAECFHMTVTALRLAEKYQMPVIVLLDFFLSNRQETVEPFEIDPSWRKSTNIEPEPGTEDEYLRYRYTKSGVSPRAIPGSGPFFHTQTGLEHDESGKPAYTSEIHRQGTEKRFKKLEGILKEGPKPEAYGPRDSETAVISWGSTFGVIRDAQRLAREGGKAFAAIKVPMVYPLHVKWFERSLKKFRNILVVELNATGQLASLLQGQLGDVKLNKVPLISSVPLKPDEVYERIRGEIL